MTKREILANLKRIHVRLECRDTDSATMFELRKVIHGIQHDMIKALPPDQARVAREMHGYTD